MSKNSIFKGVEVWNVGCATEQGSRDLHLAASTACWEHVAPVWKSCAIICNLSGWSDPLFTDQSVNNNSKLIKCSGKGGWEENWVIETECLEKMINTLSHFYSLQKFFFCNTTLDAQRKILIFCVWELNSTCASCILLLYFMRPLCPWSETKSAVEVL